MHHQDTNTNVKAWRKPRTVVVNEKIYWTPTAKMADIVMPVTSSYERDDITMTGDYSNMHIAPMKQAVELVGESKDDYVIFSDICKIYGKDVFNAYTENGKKAKDFIKEYYNSALKQTQSFGEAFALLYQALKNFGLKMNQSLLNQQLKV